MAPTPIPAAAPLESPDFEAELEGDIEPADEEVAVVEELLEPVICDEDEELLRSVTTLYPFTWMASILVAPGVTIAVFHADAGAPPDAVRYVMTSPAVIEDIHCVGYPPVVSATPSVNDLFAKCQFFSLVVQKSKLTLDNTTSASCRNQ